MSKFKVGDCVKRINPEIPYFCKDMVQGYIGQVTVAAQDSVWMGVDNLRGKSFNPTPFREDNFEPVTPLTYEEIGKLEVGDRVQVIAKFPACVDIPYLNKEGTITHTYHIEQKDDFGFRFIVNGVEDDCCICDSDAKGKDYKVFLISKAEKNMATTPTFKAMKFRGVSPEQTAQVQEHLFSLGYRWATVGKDHFGKGKASHLFTDSQGIITYTAAYHTDPFFDNWDNGPEMELVATTTYSIQPVDPSAEQLEAKRKAEEKKALEERMAQVKRELDEINKRIQEL